MARRLKQELEQREAELHQMAQTLSLLRTIEALALESHASLKLVCQHITEAITQSADYDFVGLLTLSSHAADMMTLYGWSGRQWLGRSHPGLGLSRPLHLPLHHDWFDTFAGSTYVNLQTISDSQLAHLFHSPETEVARLREQLKLQSAQVIKLRARRRLVGLLIIGSTEASALDEADVRRLEQLSETIGVALDNKLLFEENQRVLRKLKDSNTKLKALDEAKDDFISMASHQLRTPLTSVKGYLSMVMEGDVGEISPKQAEMLSQAYFSSQRMVYIIADLLNVSRLRTGKFTIDPTPVNLATLVGEEVDQLQTIARASHLELSFTPPPNFPELELDETKTRQTIMNFIDNALHYTPSGGHITVELEDKPASVELRVVDNGMGVPKGEQPHLFTKFYRATNARHSRPDGTGLGLYMAKKVIVAQGGSIIFNSREGEGSTFGFTLKKPHIRVSVT